MEVNNIRIEQAARLLAEQQVKENEPAKASKTTSPPESSQSTNVNLDNDIVEITNENLLAANNQPPVIKEASKIVRELITMLLANPAAAMSAQANLKSPKIVELL
ncbi:MAG TPA: hypothetical protein PLD27_03000 [bacterium]|nr:hypothetical protein [bacterium]HOL47058.1 hypothetical protein [bacterium]HPQ17937.1 hypothetical protein [bacterium]